MSWLVLFLNKCPWNGLFFPMVRRLGFPPRALPMLLPSRILTNGFGGKESWCINSGLPVSVTLSIDFISIGTKEPIHK
ncbi:MAG TPA: hypothetical protein PLT87_01720 [Spirochaetales bacterium]|nr:hypothetical protein [Spirochaetales bacterium]